MKTSPGVRSWKDLLAKSKRLPQHRENLNGPTKFQIASELPSGGSYQVETMTLLSSQKQIQRICSDPRDSTLLLRTSTSSQSDLEDELTVVAIAFIPSHTAPKTMKFLSPLAAFLVFFTSCGAAAKHGIRKDVTPTLDHIPTDDPQAIWDALTTHAQLLHDGDRDLQDDPISGILDLACGIIAFLIPGEVVCDCNLVLLSISFECANQQAICIGGLEGFCFTPTITGLLGILDSSLGFEFCAADATSGGVTVPGLCINFGGAVLNAFTEGDGDSDPREPVDEVTSCEASVGGVKCESCTICDDGAGYTFDCSAIDPTFVQSECTAVHLIDSLFQTEPVAFLPNLD